MQKSIPWRISLVLFLLLLSFIYLTPTMVSTLPSWWTGFLPKERITLGLDLKGGTHLVLKVDTQKAVEGYLDLLAADLEDSLDARNIRHDGAARLDEDTVRLVLYDKKSAEEESRLIKSRFPELDLAPPHGTERGGVRLEMKLAQKALLERKDKSVTQALETIRNRIDQFGVTEPVIQREGEDHIVVQLPGVTDPKRAIELIGRTARLEFKLVNENSGVSAAFPESIAEDDEILVKQEYNAATGTAQEIPIVVKKRAVISGDLLTDALVKIDPQFNEPYVAIEFNSTGARLFDQVTAANIGKRLAIILDGSVYSAPVIRDRISGGSAQISGSFSPKEAADLAITLRAGSLPAPVTIAQNVTVGPSVGQDSISKGLAAGGVGVALVVLFMGFYYRLAGLVANVGMLLNVFFLTGALAALGATLTLPGIAAIVLLVGMSVDSNVLIFERVKEEMRLGSAPRMSIDAGYDKAFLTVMDSHVTTLITAAVLFQFGTGPVKGFAVSLSLGILINLFTTLVTTKLIFDMTFSRFQIKRLSI